MDTEFLTPLEAAKYIRVHRETLYDLIRSGTIKAFKVGGRWRVPKAGLDNYLQKDTTSVIVSGERPSAILEPVSQMPLGFPRQGQPNSKRILIVDDNLHIREFFQVVLAKRGHSVVAVPSGYDAIEQVKHAVFDYVFIDLVMPELDGVETLKEIKALDPDPTIVLITGFPDGDLVTKALGMGPFVLLDKPIRVADILKVIEG